MRFEIRVKSGALPAQSMIDLPNFVAITGLNGSGKSSFLNAVRNNKCVFSDDAGKPLNVTIFADSEALRKGPKENPKGSGRQNNLSQTPNRFEWRMLEEAEKIRSDVLDSSNVEQIWMNPEAHFMQNPEMSAASEIIMNAMENHRNSREAFLTYDLESAVRKRLARINQGAIGIDFLELCNAYAAKADDNNYNQYLAGRGIPTGVPVLSDDEFLQKFGPKPWDLGNEILQNWGLNIVLTEAIGARQEPDKVKATIRSRSENEIIPPNMLSSGEQTLLTLLSEYYQATVFGRKPDLMLLDEPDAMLNPALSKGLIEMLAETFCKKLGVRVIMTTHSPTTVAAVPAGSHYLMSRFERKLRASTKEEAIAQLFIGTPELILLTENTKQVFCESDLDARIYSHLFSICRAHHSDKMHPGNLNFIAFGKNADQPENANRGQVEDLVQMLVRGGNPMARGIVDWDKSGAADKQGVIVSSKGLRHSKENVILDPLFLGLYLIKFRADQSGDLPQSSRLNFSSFSSWAHMDKQTLIDEVCATVVSKFSSIDDFDVDLVDVSYSDNEILKSPKWWMMTQGHALETKIGEAFPKLLAKQHQPLCRCVVEHINKDTGLVLNELLSTFDEILT